MEDMVEKEQWRHINGVILREIFPRLNLGNVRCLVHSAECYFKDGIKPQEVTTPNQN